MNIQNPKLWGPPPHQEPNRYVLLTKIYKDGEVIGEYETKFGLRSLEFDPENGW
ncbi:hypothetical protein [Autumnicola musiva]|uniref:Glycoside hydrolase family 2 immunoglobulin-like beta-sandwich domain-containing protein n=1 Tax=Autumnicola musiva TaxID=3075589 RepID=A0ABU3D4S4_9FLAO|nr:hypothetical protein [Zunongwangia sp. F117]MDT0676532.1 hypothetical protein [Zunongwangia sp. F117]